MNLDWLLKLGNLYFFDTSALTQYYIEDKSSSDVRNIINKSSNTTIVAMITIYEARHVLYKVHSKKEISTAIARFDDDWKYREKFKIIKPSKEIAQRLDELLRDYRPKFSVGTNDYIILATALLLNEKRVKQGDRITFCTSDKRQRDISEASGLITKYYERYKKAERDS